MNNEEIIQKNYLEWTQFPFDKETIQEVQKLKNNNHLKFQDSFYKDLSFGTGGMRGIVGYGPNRVNKYTFGKNTQGISNYINKISDDKEQYPRSTSLWFCCWNNHQKQEQGQVENGSETST